MPDNEEHSSLGALLGALTAILTVVSATLYFTGYLFLTGYYGRFGLPLTLLNLPVQSILAESGVVLVPLAFFSTLLVLLGAWRAGALFRNLPKGLLRSPWLYIGVLVFMMLMLLTMPPTGRWFADAQIAGRFTGYKLLAEPLPYVSLQCKQAVPRLANPEPGKDGAVTYRNLRLLAATDKYFYLYEEQSGTFLVPHDSVMWMGFYLEPGH